jgi:hypothetical protein
VSENSHGHAVVTSTRSSRFTRSLVDLHLDGQAPIRASQWVSESWSEVLAGLGVIPAGPTEPIGDDQFRVPVRMMGVPA